ncbi:MAG: 30S ribosomal protein S12 methylthiotransferase RimO [Bacteroidales bacterium]|nr:30S ribosomal protein S12 methylthiotransferase RimO [Bacteroidales bacterium]
MKEKNLPRRINFITLGCSKNLVDSEKIMGQFRAAGLNVVHEDKPERGDVVIINTCGFIHDAKEESVSTILEYSSEREAGNLSGLYVMGCLSQRYKQELQENIPEVDGFFGVNDHRQIIETLGVDYKKELIGERFLITPAHYAYLKVAEGCNHHCSFCAIPLIRGKHHSKPIEELINEAKALAGKGVKELILIAQDLTYYGLDLYKKRALANLLRELSKITQFRWIRLHYAYPAQFPFDVLEVMNEHPNICKYLDIPLQHISGDLLKSMRRGIGQNNTEELIHTIRRKVPGINLRTTFMVGYPGETEKDFNALKDFIQRMRFERMGVFAYSHEENTAAYQLEETVADEVKQARVDELMALQQQISAEINRNKTGTILPVVIDRREGEYLIGRTEVDSPEVDNEVLIKTSGHDEKIGEFVDVRITAASDFDLYGEFSQPGL